MKRIVVKFHGFSDAERHALDTVFRLSETQDIVYAPWTLQESQAPEVLLIDGDSWEAVLALADPSHDGLKLVWVGEAAPAQAWRVFAAPVRWSAVVEALDREFAPLTSLSLSTDLDSVHAQDLDVHFDEDESTAPSPLACGAAAAAPRRVLVVAAGADERLYLRAKLAAASLFDVDEAPSGAEALALLRSQVYALAIVDLGLSDMDSWQLIKAVDGSRPTIAHLFVTGLGPAWRQGWRARLGGAQAYLRKPLDPVRLGKLLRNI